MNKPKLYNGDCLEVMDKLTKEGVKVDAIITDPPYGTTQCRWDTVIDFDAMWERLNKLIKKNGAIALFGSEPFSSALRMSNIKCFKYDWYLKKDNKDGFLNAKKQPLREYEIASIFNCVEYLPQLISVAPFKTKILTTGKQSGIHGKVKNKLCYETRNYKYPSNTIRMEKVTDSQHPTAKPVKLMEYLIKTYTNENELVLDFTMGSGTTGVACHNTKRNFIGIELDKDYFKIATDRIEENSKQQTLF